MAKPKTNRETEIHYDLHRMIEEIKASGGLPDNLSTEAQLWDEIMKKEAYLMPEQLFPLIREVHGKSYPKETPVTPLATEFSVERSDTKEITSIRGDITVVVGKKDIYHFECQIEKDGTMVVRMFEYDVHIALSYMQSEESYMLIKFPASAVLYLQENANIPETLECKIQFQDGGFYTYKVPVMKAQSYTLDEIREKHLCVLIPFLPLRFRKTLERAERQKNEEQRERLLESQKEELTSFYEKLMLILDEEVQGGYLSERNRKTIISLLGKSLIRVFYRNDKLLKEVLTLTEPILELEFEKNERYERMIAKMDREILEKDRSLEEKNRSLAEQAQTLRKKDEEIAKLQKKLAELTWNER